MSHRRAWRNALPERAVCPYCGFEYQHHDLEPDHDVPLALGGRDDASNIVAVCVGCNRAKGARVALSESDRADVAERGKDINLRRILRQADQVRESMRTRAAEELLNELESDRLLELLGLASNTKLTGLVCPQCRQPVAVVENRLPRMLLFRCAACDYRWSAEEPGAPKQ